MRNVERRWPPFIFDVQPGSAEKVAGILRPTGVQRAGIQLVGRIVPRPAKGVGRGKTEISCKPAAQACRYTVIVGFTNSREGGEHTGKSILRKRSHAQESIRVDQRIGGYDRTDSRKGR